MKESDTLPSHGLLALIRCALVGFPGFVLLAILTSCAAPYQPMVPLGGYQEEQLAPDIYRVAFFGNGYTNPQSAAEYVIHRCAERTEQRGYRYFGILLSPHLSSHLFPLGTKEAAPAVQPGATAA
jgi:hypothetical protein